MTIPRFDDSMIPRLRIIIAACFLFSCGTDTVFNKFQPVKDRIWDKQDEYYFTFEIKETSIPYDISVLLRNSDIYPYQNIWMLIDQSDKAGTTIKDTVEHILADDFGKWTGNGITLFQSRVPIKNQYIFPDTGKYTISVRHGMRDDKLKGIEDIGLFVEKSPPLFSP